MSAAYDKIIELLDELTPDEKERLSGKLNHTQQSESTVQEIDDQIEPTWTEEELAKLTRIEPLPGAEVVALGLTGGWADMGIEDSVEWLEEQRRKRRERKNYTW